MSLMESARSAVNAVTSGDQRLGDAAENLLEQAGERFGVDAQDFISAREFAASAGTRIEQRTAPLDKAGQILNRSFSERDSTGRFTNVITPMVIPKTRAFWSLIPVALLILVGLAGAAVTAPLGLAVLFFGPHYWLIVLIAAVYAWWRRSVVMVPEGCQALITRFGKLEHIAGPGRKTLLSPWKKVSYIVNTTREYPYNAPIHEAPTEGGVMASVDLFLQFRIEDPAEFVFVLGSTNGFSDKLQNAVSEVTRGLIYQQPASGIYDLVGESTADVLETLNGQFLPAVRLTNSNITHAEPSNQQYRMDLASPEIVRMAKDAYTHEYELQLTKQQSEGELNKELASLNENLSNIQAEIAGHQARIDTAFERETNRANAQARQRFVEAESEANANAALLEAQALDIRAVGAAEAPEILEYRFQQEILSKLEEVAEHLPQVVHVGDDADGVDYLRIARELVGSSDGSLFTEQEMSALRQQLEAIQQRIGDREDEVTELLAAMERDPDAPPEGYSPAEDRVDEIRRSVSDEPISERVAEAHGTAGGTTPAEEGE